MMAKRIEKVRSHSTRSLPKALTGIAGLDEVSFGGLPRGRTTIVCGGPGCGKTMLGLEFVVRGAMEFDEPGVILAFEETVAEMTRNVASLGFDLDDLVRRKKLFMEFVHIEPREIQETGEYDLEGLFIRLQHAVKSVGAKRVMLDTLEALFSGFSNEGILRAEIRRLFRWLKERNLTTVVTAEKGAGTLTRHGLEEYVSDCVILLDHRINEQVSTRRMRIVKYRGTKHGADEYPFLIDEDGISVLPITSIELNHDVSSQRVSSGVADLDAMLGGKGFYRGTSVMISGTAGSGKTTLASTFAEASARRGERCLYIGLEESNLQVARNMRSVGVDLETWVRKGVLVHEAWRPTQYGMEMHLLRIHKLIARVKPRTLVIDPVSNLINNTTQREVQSMLTRLIDFLKDQGITFLFTSLTHGGAAREASDEGVSSLIDTWILLRDVELNGERNRVLHVLKSRGMAHSNQLREFVMSSSGIHLLPPYVGPAGVLTGTSRLSQEALENAEARIRQQDIDRKRGEIERKRRALEAQIDILTTEFSSEEKGLEKDLQEFQHAQAQVQSNRVQMARSRGADGRAATNGSKK
jgi:circadian clock protein KaiC